MNFAARDNNKSVPVIAAVIMKESACLVCKRPAHKRHGNLWEFPGGKIKQGETFEQAARRELKEELGVRLISIGRFLETVRDPGSPFLIHFVVAEISGEPKPVEHQEIGWYKSGDLKNLPLAPADAEFVRSDGFRKIQSDQ